MAAIYYRSLKVDRSFVSISLNLKDSLAWCGHHSLPSVRSNASISLLIWTQNIDIPACPLDDCNATGYDSILSVIILPSIVVVSMLEHCYQTLIAMQNFCQNALSISKNPRKRHAKTKMCYLDTVWPKKNSLAYNNSRDSEINAQVI
jgi:hypothetical protein